MNKTFKTIWNPNRAAFVCVSEQQGLSHGSVSCNEKITPATRTEPILTLKKSALLLAVLAGFFATQPIFAKDYNNQSIFGKTVTVGSPSDPLFSHNISIGTGGKLIVNGDITSLPTQQSSGIYSNFDGDIEVKGTLTTNNLYQLRHVVAHKFVNGTTASGRLQKGFAQMRSLNVDSYVGSLQSRLMVGDNRLAPPVIYDSRIKDLYMGGSTIEFYSANVTIDKYDYDKKYSQNFYNSNSIITVGGLTGNLKNHSYKHIAPRAQIDLGGYWFEKSKIWIAQNAMMERDNLGLQNEYTVEKGGRLKVDLYDGMSTVFLGIGGLLDVKEITLNPGKDPQDGILLMGGTLLTSVGQLFDVTTVGSSGSVDGIPLYPEQSEVPNINVTIPGAGSGGTVNSILGLKEDVNKSLEFYRGTSSSINFNDAVVTQNVVTQATDILSQKAAKEQGRVKVSFQGKIVTSPSEGGGSSSEVVFTDDVTNDMFAANPDVQVILNKHTLNNGSKTSGTLEVANSSSSDQNGWIKESVGFKNVNGFEKVVIKDGKDFALVGETDASYSKMIDSADVSGVNSKFTLGSSLVKQGTGTVNAITASNGGEVVARGGTYKIGTLDAVQNGKLNNEAAHLTVTGTLKVEGIGSQVKNTGTLVAQSLDLKTNNGLINEGQYKTVGTTNITGGSTSMATDTFAFHNKAKAQAQFTGKTTIGSVHSGQTDMLASGPLERPTFMNEGTANFAELELLRGAELRNWNGGVMTANSLTMDAFSSLTNTGTLTISGEMNLKGTVRNNGTINGQRVLVEANMSSNNTGTMNMGTLTLQEGSQFSTTKDAVVSNLEMAEGSTFSVVGEGSTATVRFDEPVNGIVRVDRGNMTIGYRAIDKLKLAEETPKSEENGIDNQGDSAQTEAVTDLAIATLSEVDGVLPTRSTLVLEHSSFTLGSNGKLLVGTGFSEEDFKEGDAHFGADSDFVVNTSFSNSLIGNGQGHLSVEDGSKLTIKSQGWGSYQIAKDFASVDMDAWKDNVTTETTDRDVHFVETEHGLNVTIGSNNILDKLPTLAISNIANAVISDAERHNNLGTGIEGFISRGTDDGVLAEAQQAKVINSAANIMGTSGVMTHNMMMANNVTNAIVDRLTFAQPTHAQISGFTFWNNILGQELKSSRFEFTGGKSQFDGQNHGFILGADYQTSNKLRFGMAFGYQDGKTTSEGFVKTKADTEGLSVTGYMSKDLGILNLMGSLGYTKLDNEINQNLNVLGTQSLDFDSEIITADATAELRLWTNGKTTVLPHTGLRSVTVKSSDSFSELNGENGFRFESDSVHQFQIPLGVKISHVSNTRSGWVFGTTADLFATFVSGDLDQKIKVHGAGASDTVANTFADEVTGTISINMMASRNNTLIGFGVGYAAGESTHGNISLGARAQIVF